ncbi:ABC transporter ATP-binding protein [Mesorhizobium sp. NZP2298]|uniref:ABC transporter ATP-binding protein n=1 Tax=Mesorhizobium sp. NZP2298 TaxID=2483403 RepID=UPI001553297C|nr:ABC transporter ATP-binding protein [Mesorhizobium sp. NZP2298]QKC95260.1 ABC transporter ATP-binding protein [Mesorhizobium sp. NZP2298]
MADLLALEGIRKSFNVGTPVETEVLHGIDLAMRAGEFVALMGPSGSGKSTLLNIIGLLDRPTSGRLSIAGEDTTRLSEASLTHLRGHAIGFVFQYHYLISAFTAHENVMMPMLVDHGRPDATMARRADELLDQVGLGRWRDNRAMNMSGGQQQRVAIARALVMNPSLVLADEPTGNLDTVSADGVFELMRRFNRERGTTFLIVTHNHDLADRCDRMIEVIDGQITQDHDNPGEKEATLTQPSP